MREGDTVWIVTTRRAITDPETKRPSEEIEVEFFSELPDEHRPRYVATIEHISDPDDSALNLAVLKVVGIPADIQPHDMYPDDILLNTAVTLIGHPFTTEAPWHVTSGIINHVNTDILTIETPVSEGNLGSPIMNGQGQMLGMVVQIGHDRDTAPSPHEVLPTLRRLQPKTGEIALAYPINVVLEQLRAWEVMK